MMEGVDGQFIPQRRVKISFIDFPWRVYLEPRKPPIRPPNPQSWPPCPPPPPPPVEEMVAWRLVVEGSAGGGKRGWRRELFSSSGDGYGRPVMGPSTHCRGFLNPPISYFSINGFAGVIFEERNHIIIPYVFFVIFRALFSMFWGPLSLNTWSLP